MYLYINLPIHISCLSSAPRDSILQSILPYSSYASLSTKLYHFNLVTGTQDVIVGGWL